tara:strand:- start:327 stop:746 length:420 start_codon:yes stop_codon:yes gene_type:complete
MKRRVPTDLGLLQYIYDQHKDEFSRFEENHSGRETKIYIPIDCLAIANHFKTDPDIIFGRLYYHLERQFGLSNPDGSVTPFFSKQVGGDLNCVNFPLLVSILAGLQQENRHFWTATGIAILALGISVLSLGISLWQYKP